jgi:hypothetical protein
MTYAIRVKDDYVGLMGRYVAEGQAIMPGAPLVDIMTPEGVVETILSEAWGVVAHIEGSRIFSDSHRLEDHGDEDEENDGDEDGENRDSGQGRSSGGGAGMVFSKGDVLCHIVARNNRAAGKKTGLHPRPAPFLRRLRLGDGA